MKIRITYVTAGVCVLWLAAWVIGWCCHDAVRGAYPCKARIGNMPAAASAPVKQYNDQAGSLADLNPVSTNIDPFKPWLNQANFYAVGGVDGATEAFQRRHGIYGVRREGRVPGVSEAIEKLKLVVSGGEARLSLDEANTIFAVTEIWYLNARDCEADDIGFPGFKAHGR